jgi:hypothetical protein
MQTKLSLIVIVQDFMRPLLTSILLTFCLAASPATTTVTADQPLKPTLKFPTAESYEKEIAEPAVLLQSDHVWLFAPKRKSSEAAIIFKYLVAAYDQLYAIVGVHTKYKIVVYHLPKGWGGTSECVIEYDYSNLDLDKFDEWRRYKVPHVSGYIEEIAHNFVGTTHAQFGWEMIGWNLGVKVTQKVAPNPIFANAVAATRKEQAATFARYRANDFVFPSDLEANLCDRVHSHLLYQCEQRYGPNFYRDFFAEIRKERRALDDAVNIKGDDNIRDARYRITVDCFDRLPRVGFKKLLEQNRISTTIDVKSLHPTDSEWDRRFTPPAAR